MNEEINPSSTEVYQENEEQFEEAEESVSEGDPLEKSLKIIEEDLRQAARLKEQVELESKPAIEAFLKWSDQRQRLREQVKRAEAYVREMGSDNLGILAKIKETQRLLEEKGKDSLVEKGRELYTAQKLKEVQQQEEKAREEQKRLMEKQKQVAKEIVERSKQVSHFGRPFVEKGERFSYAGIVQQARDNGLLEEVTKEEYEKAVNEKQGYKYLKFQKKFYTFLRKNVWNAEQRREISVPYFREAGEAFKAIKNMEKRCVRACVELDMAIKDAEKNGGKVIKRKDGVIILEKVTTKKDRKGFRVVLSTSPKALKDTFYLEIPKSFYEEPASTHQSGKQEAKNKKVNSEGLEEEKILSINLTPNSKEDKNVIAKALEDAGYKSE